MQITDEMVEAALAAYHGPVDKSIARDCAVFMRAALEAALGARSGNASDFVKQLKDSAYWQSNEDYAKAAACIEDLAAALRLIIPPLHGVCGGPLVCTKAIYEDGTNENTKRHKGSISPEDYYRARATLERWGLK